MWPWLASGTMNDMSCGSASSLDCGAIHSAVSRRRRRWPAVLGIAITAVGLTVAVGLALVHAFNPVADEWHCSQGRAPAHNRVGGSECFKEGSTLPEGYRWDRWGNRPLAHSCDDDGWVLVTNRTDNRTECVRDQAALPRGWRHVDG